MRFHSTLLGCVSVGALASTALAQDSVSLVNNPGTGGDAIDARAVGEQENTYVVDQTIVRGSWGTVFGVAPLVKATQQRATLPVNYSGFLIAQHLSRDLLSVPAFARSSYGVWNATGFGVNDDPARNSAPAALSAAGLTGFQFGAGFSEGGTGAAGTAPPTLHRITSAVVNFTDARPSRLYVARVMAAIDNLADDCDFGSLHLGSVDADGNIYFRGDNNGALSGNCPLPQLGTTILANNIYRVRALSRTPGVVNSIESTGPVDVTATDHLIVASGTTQNCPNNLPNSIAGYPALVGADFGNTYVYESSAMTLSSVTTHRAPGTLQQRGSFGLTAIGFPFLGAGAVATCGVVGKDTAASAEGAPLMNLWGIDSNGDVTGTIALELPPEAAVPAAITDPDQPTWSSSNVPGPSEFDHYHSQTVFQGGNGQVAIGADQSGNLLAAACVYYGLSYATPPAIASHLAAANNYLAVARVDPSGTTTSWSVAAWTQETTTPAFSDGKIVYQNGVTPIGRLTGALFGPAMSAPMIDSVGNVWFVGNIELSGAPATTHTALLRAVYDEPTFSYKLELVAREGQTLQGRNSATAYQILDLDLKDGDSISSSAAWSGNVSSQAFKGQSTVGMATSDSATLGGLILHARIIYDVDNNGLFELGSGATPPVPGSPDEDYNVLLYFSSAVDGNGNDVPDDGEIPGTPFCFGDGTLTDHTTACPCGNNGAPGNGCAHSFSAAGANISAYGIVATDSVPNPSQVVLHTTNSPAAAFTLFMQHDALDDRTFHDGTLCANGTLIRLRGRNAAAGQAFFPNSNFANDSTLTLSQRGLVTVGSGATRYYAGWYRNASTTFCPPATANVTNGYRIVW